MLLPPALSSPGSSLRCNLTAIGTPPGSAGPPETLHHHPRRMMSSRARMMLMLADGMPYTAIEAALGCSSATVALWKQRFVEGGLAGLGARLVRQDRTRCDRARHLHLCHRPGAEAPALYPAVQPHRHPVPLVLCRSQAADRSTFELMTAVHADFTALKPEWTRCLPPRSFGNLIPEVHSPHWPNR